MSYQTHKRFLLLTTLTLAGCLPVLTHAAQPAAAMEPLVVTAERDAASALLEKDLDLFQVDAVAGLSGLVPGFAVVTSDTRGYGDIISMRGSANTLFFSPPAVGMVVDDVPMGDTCSYPSGLLEYDQVRILRGPQGTIYGRNGAAGMLDMTTPRPGVATETRLTTDFGSYNAWGASLRTGGPLGGGFAQTLQLYHQQRDGFIDNTTLGRTTDDRSLTGGLANLYWKPAPDTEWRLRVLAERANDGGARLSLLDSRNPFRVESDIPGKTDMERYQVSLHYTKEGPWGRFKSITAWQDWQLDPSVTDLDLTASPPGLGMSSTIIQDQRLWTQEFRWESPQDAGPWSWRTGLFFMNQASTGDATRAFPVDLMPGYAVPYSERTRYAIDQWNVAAYGRATYDVNARLKLLAGVRLEYVNADIDRTKTSASPALPPGYIPAPSVVREDMGDWYFTPEIGASYALCENVRLFARGAMGIKPAGFSAFASTAGLARYEDEVALTHELGAEISLPDHHLTCSLTGYWNHIDDYQLNRQAPKSTDFYTANAGTVTSLGVETAVRWQPVDGLTVQGSAGLVHARFDDAPSDGNAVPYVPEFTASLGARYDFPKGFYLQSAVRMTGTTYFNEANTDRYSQGSYLCWDAEIGYAVERFSVALYGRNLLDREYYTFINPQIEAGSPGDPQVFGIRATLQF
ncbi:MAG: TonB-dependent receptor [Verrucomicrobia bacterium]|nr:TonB-dependent receptor [Verrucomicrobiota bacterium]